MLQDVPMLKAINFSPLLEHPEDWAEQTEISDDHVQMMDACFVHYGGDVGLVLRYLGGEYTAEWRNGREVAAATSHSCPRRTLATSNGSSTTAARQSSAGRSQRGTRRLTFAKETARPSNSTGRRSSRPSSRRQGIATSCPFRAGRSGRRRTPTPSHKQSTTKTLRNRGSVGTARDGGSHGRSP